MLINYYLIEFKSSYTLILIMIIIGLILYYITNWNEKEIYTEDYIKLILYTTFITGITIYINKIKYSDIEKLRY